MKHSVIRFGIMFDGTYHVGSGWDVPGIDALVARDSRGIPCVHGSTLAGVMRAEATRLAPHLFGEKPCHRITAAAGVCTCATCELFGSWRARPDEGLELDNESDPTHASPLTVHHARPTQTPSATVADRASISRRTGATEEHRKFNLELIEPEHPFAAILEISRPTDRQLQLLDAVLREAHAGRVVIGGRAGGGLGWLKISDPQFVELELSDLDVLCSWLEHDIRDPSNFELFSPTPFRTSLGARGNPRLVPPNFIDVSFNVSFSEHELIDDPALAALDLTHGKHVRRLNGALFLPGSSQRGAIRSRAERILRRQAPEQVPVLRAACDPFDRAVRSDSRSCAARIQVRIAGSQAPNLHRIVEEETCLACQLFGHEYRGGCIRIADARIAAGVTEQSIDYVAIDRFTGGAHTGSKFDVRAPCAPTYQGRIVLRDYEDWMTGLLLLTLRDLIEGDLPLGGKTRRGMGRALGSITSWTEGIMGPPVPAWAGTDGRIGSSGVFTTATWAGLPCAGAPREFLTAEPDSLEGVDDRFMKPLNEKLSELRAQRVVIEEAT